jgi:hypothetical protein
MLLCYSDPQWIYYPSIKRQNGDLGMKIQDIKDIAKKHNVTAGKMKKTDLIRAIQVAEGNKACFATSSIQTCGQMTCLWSTDCN